MSQGVECYSCLPKTAWPPTSANVESAECAEEACKVTVRVTYDYREMKSVVPKGILMKGVGLVVIENWIIEDGRLRYVWAP